MLIDASKDEKWWSVVSGPLSAFIYVETVPDQLRRHLSFPEVTRDVLAWSGSVAARCGRSIRINCPGAVARPCIYSQGHASGPQAVAGRVAVEAKSRRGGGIIAIISCFYASTRPEGVVAGCHAA